MCWRARAGVRTCVRACVFACMRVCVRAYVSRCACVRARVRVCERVRVRVGVCVCLVCVFALYDNIIWPRLIMIIINIIQRLPRRSAKNIYFLVDVSECAGKPYDENTHICCRGKLHARLKFMPECCGNAVISPARTICCRRYSFWGGPEARIVEVTKGVNPSTVCLSIWDTPSSPE